MQFFFEKLGKFLSTDETFISNSPQTIGAVALAIVTLGVVWFKFAEENMDSCVPVHYCSHHCIFYEFPGCFECEISTKWYNFAVHFHYCCFAVAGTVAFSFVLKIIVTPTVVVSLHFLFSYSVHLSIYNWPCLSFFFFCRFFFSD